MECLRMGNFWRKGIPGLGLLSIFGFGGQFNGVGLLDNFLFWRGSSIFIGGCALLFPCRFPTG